MAIDQLSSPEQQKAFIKNKVASVRNSLETLPKTGDIISVPGGDISTKRICLDIINLDYTIAQQLGIVQVNNKVHQAIISSVRKLWEDLSMKHIIQKTQGVAASYREDENGFPTDEVISEAIPPNQPLTQEDVQTLLTYVNRVEQIILQAVS